MADDFLSRVEQVEANIGELGFKLPLIVRDARIFSAVFPASIHKLRRLLPNEDLSPAQLLPGMGIVQLTAYEYSDTDIGPYNEFSVVIPLSSPRFAKIPFYNLFKARTVREVHNFLLHRAADAEAAVRILKDHHLWPQFLASIEFTESDDWVTCEVKEDGELICRLRGRKIPAQHMDVVRVFIYTPQHPQPQRADINPDLSATTQGSSNAELALGSSHPIAVELSETLRSLKPRMYTYGPRWQLIAYGPA